MSERSELISKLKADKNFRTAYIKAKLGALVPSQIRALRLKSDMPRQSDLAEAAEMHQSRISTFETPGAANFTLETLSRLAAVFEVGLIVKFVPFSDMLRWENSFSQDSFDVLKLSKDFVFTNTESRRRPIRLIAGGLDSMGATKAENYPKLQVLPGQLKIPFATASSEINSAVDVRAGRVINSDVVAV